MELKIYEFAGTTSAAQMDESVQLNNNDTLLLVDRGQKVLKPGESYLITISKVGTQPIIIEEIQNEEEETTKETKEMA